MTTEQIIEEREDSIKMKMRFKRFLSGFMAVATLASTIIQPVTVSASELEPEKIPFEQQYAELKDVQDSLDPNEIVKANDIELSYGQEFDVEVDLSGIEGVDESKIKILFHEAKNEAGTDFDTHTPDTYKAVYAVEPVSGHPAYRVSRNITVKEPKTEAITTSNSSENTTGEGNAGETEDIGTADDEETDRQTETEVVTDLTEESETTTDEETGLTVSDVMEQADEEGIDLYSLDEGESVTFMARVASTTSTKKVTVTRGACYQYSDYGYGSYLTYQYTVKFGSVSATAYCIQPEKSSPGSGTYDIIKLSDGKKLAKVCYYGTKASGDDGFFTEENGYGNLSTGARFILVHLAASYANSGDSAFSGASSKAKTLAMKLYNYCISQPNIPDVEMSFSDANVTAYVDGSSQRTKEITFKADELQSITMKLPSGVKLHNVTTGKTSKAGESVVISGGTKFYLSAPLTQVSDVAGSWSATMKGNITKDYSAYKISTGSGSQDLALVFGEGVDDEKYVDFKVTWVQYASVKVIKKDSKANAKLSGAVFGLYSDADCKNLITKLPATDANGEASAQIVKTQDTVYLKEITAPSGYRINATAYNVKLEVSKTTTVTVPDEEQLGQLTVYKEGEVLAGAEVTENGTTFRYEKRRQKGAVYNVYAGADITTAYGTKVYSKHGFLYLTAIIDWYSRCIVGWDVDDTLDTTMVINACKKAFKVAKPLIINSDQGSQFTSDKYIAFIRDNGIRQSMDGKSRWADNIMIERWFRSFKYEEAYLTEYANLKEARETMTDGSKRYNCTIIDLHDRSVISSITDKNITADLAKRTLEKAIHSQPGIDLSKLLLHSDQGSQYTSKEFTEFCEKLGITQSMSKAGYPYDKAST